MSNISIFIFKFVLLLSIARTVFRGLWLRVTEVFEMGEGKGRSKMGALLGVIILKVRKEFFLGVIICCRFLNRFHWIY